MPERDARPDAVRKALAACVGDDRFKDHAAVLLDALGYRSELTEDFGSVEEFVNWLDHDPKRPLTDKQRHAFKPWRAADIVFQFTDDEINAFHQGGLFASAFDRGRAKSFLFVAIDLEPPPDGHPYSRTELATTTRIINSRVAMPVILLFRHGDTLTLAAVHRRAHRRDAERDVLERVTLIKDIRATDPHRAHLDILCELTLEDHVRGGVRTFDDLHKAWERVLDIEELNRRFYRELFAWFERAADECTFPDDGAGDGFKERHAIRLITRLLFIWFLKEKGLVPERLFDDNFAAEALKSHDPERTDYYQAVLQNLFFATLNTPSGQRAFSSRSQKTHRDFSLYRYRDLLTDPDDFVASLKVVPFVNGGLFDCMDDFKGRTAGGRRVDVFTDNENQRGELDVPARLLFDNAGLFPLFRRFKFTVEENTPIDQEVALDPELLGSVFEHLLAAYNPETRETARKTTGSYYTPRKVVDYMVHEALTEALAATAKSTDGDKQLWREQMDYLLDHSDAMDDASDLFSDTERAAVVTAIANLKVLDPAVGSGAFPMAILQTLTLALRRLDPGNALWEALQKQRATARAEAAFDTDDQQQRDAELAEISDTFEKYRQSDFGRKLYLIQNSIFGVDIQPIACQIAKLRFFISLVIEQAADPAADNLGIKPLPNLETRFVAADTLLGLEQPKQFGLTSEAVRQLQEALGTNRERHFHAGYRNAKLALRDEDTRLRRLLADELRRTHGFNTSAAEIIAAWDPYDQNACADWFDAEYMFGVSDGFDVVIGNPPYIQLQRDGGQARRRYASAGFETLTTRGDIYQLFYERGGRLLKSESGTLAYITSNSWLKAEYGKPLRRWFGANHTPLRLVEMGKDVFDAIVDTSVLLVREGGLVASFPAIDVNRTPTENFPPREKTWGTVRPADGAPWSILSSVEWDVHDKMSAAGKPLKDWDVQINRGVITGYNEAFIIDSDTRAALIREDPRSSEIIKPVLRGRDIRRWRAAWAGKWLIVARFGSYKYLANDYPAVYRHLAQHEEALRARGQCRYTRSGRNRNLDYDGQHHWLELDNNPKDDYIDLFEKEKLLWIELADQGRFSYDDSGILGEATTFILTGEHPKYLCAVLNSILTRWYLGHAAPTSGMGTPRWKKVYVQIVPIPTPNRSTEDTIVRVVDQILAAKDADPHADVTALDNEIDQLVYALYGLTDKEITAVARS